MPASLSLDVPTRCCSYIESGIYPKIRRLRGRGKLVKGKDNGKTGRYELSAAYYLFLIGKATETRTEQVRHCMRKCVKRCRLHRRRGNSGDAC